MVLNIYFTFMCMYVGVCVYVCLCTYVCISINSFRRFLFTWLIRTRGLIKWTNYGISSDQLLLWLFLYWGNLIFAELWGLLIVLAFPGRCTSPPYSFFHGYAVGIGFDPTVLTVAATTLWCICCINCTEVSSGYQGPVI